MDIEVAKSKLTQEREQLRQLETSRSENYELGESQKESIGALSTVDQHPADLATNTFERAKESAIEDQISEQIDKIDRALERIEDGSYGKCEVCAEPISEERLEALPASDRCAEHQADREDRV